MNNLNILIDCDENLVFPTATMMRSLRKHTPKSYKITYYFAYYIDAPLKDESMQILRNQLCDNDSIVPIPEPHSVIEKYVSPRWGPQTIIRLLVLHELAKTEEKILHIDGDVIIRGSILPYYDVDLFENNAIIATQVFMNGQEQRNKRNGLIDNITLNAGVMLFNLNKIIELLPTKQDMEDYIGNKHSLIEGALDQSFLNLYFQNYKGVLPNDKYMHISTKCLNVNKNYISKNPIIIHYLGDAKPWRHNSNTTYWFTFWHYAKHVYGFKFYITIIFKRLYYLLIHYSKALWRRIKRKY